MSSEQRCALCGGPVVYQAFSGGREYWCEPCDFQGSYNVETQPRRLKMLAEGKYDDLRAEMRAELERRRTS